MTGFEVEAIRQDFPIFSEKMNNKPLVYLDNAASTQKPRAVIDRVKQFYESEYATVNRGVYALGGAATEMVETVRKQVQEFIGARESSEIIFTRGTTESINLVAHAYGRKFLGAGDEIIISVIEHHSNIVPWQILCEEKGINLKVIPVNDKGELLLDAYEELISKRTKLVSIGHISNALGTINPLKVIIDRAHSVGAKVVVDGAQGAPHSNLNVMALDCDFYGFSGHKLFGPTGVGVLYGKKELLEKMDPFLGGGDMIKSVSMEKTEYADPPQKFEAGTPPIAQIIGMGAALKYITQIGMDAIVSYEQMLLKVALEALDEIEDINIIGTAENKASVISFLIGDIHPHDIGTVMDQEGIAIRAGHHCAQPTMRRFKVPATARASFSLYNTVEDIHALVRGIHKVKEIFQ
ncbi:MAG: cysteine desulfurase [Candidatus Margulisbacteria bacterium]|nr:cysteine desulfurase [Candidatus Margulisiibacteriota bacterium]